MAGGRAGVADLRGPRLLTDTPAAAADLKAALAREAHALGFDTIGITDPAAIDGVARVTIGGEARPSTRIWFNAEKLAAFWQTAAIPA